MKVELADLNHDGFLMTIRKQSIYNVPNAKIGLKYASGNSSNRNGIGARVEIYGAWGSKSERSEVEVDLVIKVH